MKRRTLPADPPLPELEVYEPDLWVDKWLVEPPHEVRDRRHLAKLVESLATRGWAGRPLLAETVRGGWRAWTGSHRLWAARRVERVTEVPVVVLDKRAYVRVHGRPSRSYCSDTFDDEDRLGRLLECGDHRAALLMARELKFRHADAVRLLRRPGRRVADPEVVGIRPSRRT